MTPEQEIAALRAELAEERAERRRLSETLRVMVEAQAKERAAEAHAKSMRRERNARHRRASPETASETSRAPAPSSSPPPSFSLSPPSAPSPSILYPFSPASPPPPPAASQALAAPAPLVLAVQEASPPAVEKPRAPPRPSALGEFIDWAREAVKTRLPEGAPDVAAMAQHQRIKLGEAVKLHGLEHVKAGFRLFMGWQGAQEKGYPLGLFASGWEGWVRQAMAAPGGGAKRTQGPTVSSVDEFDQDIPGAKPARSTA